MSMKSDRIAVAIYIVNILFFTFLVAESRTAADAKVVPLVEARAIHLVDEKGKIRAQLDVEKTTGEVVFRLRDSKGTIRTKLGAGEDGSGLSMMDERTEATVQIRANKDGGGISSLTAKVGRMS